MLFLSLSLVYLVFVVGVSSFILVFSWFCPWKHVFCHWFFLGCSLVFPCVFLSCLAFSCFFRCLFIVFSLEKCFFVADMEDRGQCRENDLQKNTEQYAVLACSLFFLGFSLFFLVCFLFFSWFFLVFSCFCIVFLCFFIVFSCFFPWENMFFLRWPAEEMRQIEHHLCEGYRNFVYSVSPTTGLCCPSLAQTRKTIVIKVFVFS